jgi:hypothetical protein
MSSKINKLKKQGKCMGTNRMMMMMMKLLYDINYYINNCYVVKYKI